MKRVLVQFEFPNLGAQQYDAIWSELKESGHEHPFGLIYHAGAPLPNGGWLWVDLWETEEHFTNFSKDLMQFFSRQGTRATQPRVLPARYVYEAAYNDSVI